MAAAADGATLVTKTLSNGPQPGVKYPVKVQYCGECSLPTEFCEFLPTYDKCLKWMEQHLPDLFEQLHQKDGDGEPGEGDADGDQTKKSTRQKRGGKGLVKTKKKADVDKFVKLGRANRGKKKFVTVVTGLATFDIDLKEAAKFFASRFACGSSVTGTDEIVIQGDVKDDLFDLIPEKWKQIDEDAVEDIGDIKK